MLFTAPMSSHWEVTRQHFYMFAFLYNSEEDETECVMTVFQIAFDLRGASSQNTYYPSLSKEKLIVSNVCNCAYPRRNTWHNINGPFLTQLGWMVCTSRHLIVRDWSDYRAYRVSPRSCQVKREPSKCTECQHSCQNFHHRKQHSH